MTGQTISHYRVLEKLGEGGMGVVYKAVDMQLDRTVALKFLQIQDGDGDELRERFLREAKAAAALDHPAVCTIHECGEAEGRMFLAMAYIDGITVSEKIRERPLKIGEALDIAIQAAEGLRAAHASGIVHRDIKSANIMVTRQGQVKITDFGLAHLADRTRLTRTKMALGTPAYMSPEQAQAQPVDRRSDIWSLGVVLYAMATGRTPFEGDREEAVLYAIVHHAHEPITALRVGVPAELDRIVGKALAKNPADRYQHVDDLIVDLSALKKRMASGESTPVSGTGATNARGWTKYAMYGALAVVTAYAAWVSIVHFGERPERIATAAATILVHAGLAGQAPDSRPVAISPDGKHIAYMSGGSGGAIWIRDMDREQSRQLVGTENARAPFWSPDSAFVGFFSGLQLKKVAAGGGAVTTVCTVPQSYESNQQGSWSPDGNSIVFGIGQLYSVSAHGGAPKRIGKAGFRDPSFLPNEGPRAVLASSGPQDLPQIAVVNVDTGEAYKLADGALPVYSRTGHILFQPSRGRSGVWALPISLETLRSAGEAFLVAEQAVSVTVSDDGTLVYVTEDRSGLRQLGWRGRSGAPLGALGAPQADIAGIALSPDDRWVAVSNMESGNRDIWVQDARRKIANRMTFGPGPASLPRWSPTSTEVVYSAYRSGNWDVLIRATDGNSEPRIVAGTSRDEYSTDWSADGNFVLLTVMNR